MADNFQLSAQKREISKTHRSNIRGTKRTLGVIYGHGVTATPVSFDASELLKVYRKAGYSSLITVELDGKKHKVIIRDVQIHPTKSDINHIDLYSVDLKQKTVVEVPLKFVGESPAVKVLGGIFTPIRTSLEIRCLPEEIPHEITVDISGIQNIGETITVENVNIDRKKFEIMHLDPSKVVCLVTGQEVEKEEAKPAEGEATAADVPVIAKEKADADAAGGDKKEEKKK